MPWASARCTRHRGYAPPGVNAALATRIGPSVRLAAFPARASSAPWPVRSGATRSGHLHLRQDHARLLLLGPQVGPPENSVAGVSVGKRVTANVQIWNDGNLPTPPSLQTRSCPCARKCLGSRWGSSRDPVRGTRQAPSPREFHSTPRNVLKVNGCAFPRCVRLKASCIRRQCRPHLHPVEAAAYRRHCGSESPVTVTSICGPNPWRRRTS